jgi:membrane-associated protease RseP (regulator of RpoE activity)
VWLCALSLVVTFLTLATTHAALWQREDSLWSAGVVLRATVFSCTLLALLAAHEAGHVFAARVHGVGLGWPIFLPAPLWFGTLGAILRWPSHPVEGRVRFAIAAAGPAAGLLAVALVSLGCDLLPAAARGAAPVRVESSWLSRQLLAEDTTDPADPIRLAVWVFLWVTSVNLLPFGELDGGHLLRAVAPGAQRTASWTVVGLLGILGMWWPGWWVWVAAMVAVARTKTSPHPPEGGLGATAWWMAVALWTVAALAWLSVPFRA